MKEALVSVIIPNYNTSDTIDECVASVLKSSYRNIEVLLVNDGSTDDTLQHMTRLQESDSRIRIINLQKNRGLPGARNAGIRRANGAFIAFVDGDDTIHEDMIEKLLHISIELDSDLTVSAINEYEVSYFPKPYGLCDKDEFINKVLTDEIQSYVWRSLYKSDLFRNTEANLFDEEIRVLEDGDFTFRIANECKRIAATGETLYNYVEGRPGAITNKRKENPWLYYVAIVTFRKYAFARSRLNGEPLKEILKKAAGYAGASYWKSFGSGTRRKEREELRALLQQYSGEISELGYTGYKRYVINAAREGKVVLPYIVSKLFACSRAIKRH